MRAYSTSSEEALCARHLLRDWAGEGFITEAQYRQMEEETISGLRPTNIFLRLLLFLFTLIIVGAAAGLFFTIFLSRPPAQTTGAVLLIFAAVSYTAAEIAVSRGRFYRHGIEEALAVCSVVFLFAGMQAAFLGNGPLRPGGAQFFVPGAAATLSLWIWHRFGFWYALPGAMAFVALLPTHWTSSHSAQRLIIAAFYAAGIAVVAAVRSRHRFDYLSDRYSLAEAFLWLGIYLGTNLQLPWSNAAEFPKPVYWATWVLIWCLPPVVLARGLREKNRFVIAVGAITAILTFIANKPYLGWPRHTWDPMLLGALLIGVAALIRRWLAAGPGGIRYGFTAERLSGTDKQWMNAAAAVGGQLSPHSLMPGPRTASPEVRFGGGDSAGGGASSDF